MPFVSCTTPTSSCGPRRVGRSRGRSWVGRRSCASSEQLRETWDADALEPISDFIDAGDRVVVRFIWRGAGHGPEANMEMTGVFTVRKGRIVCHGVLLGSRRGPRSRWGCRSRRCRRRTWRSCEQPSRLATRGDLDALALADADSEISIRDADRACLKPPIRTARGVMASELAKLWLGRWPDLDVGDSRSSSTRATQRSIAPVHACGARPGSGAEVELARLHAESRCATARSSTPRVLRTKAEALEAAGLSE